MRRLVSPRFLLINPTDGPESEYGKLAAAATQLPQLGLAAIAAALQENGFSADICDAHVHGLDENSLLELIRQGNYGVVGFSVYVTTERRALAYAAAIKRTFPHVIVCAGGPQVTLVPARFHDSVIDYIFVGEADDSIVEFATALTHSSRPTGIVGVVDGSQPFPDEGVSPRLVNNIDNLPPIRLDRYYPLESFYPPVHVRGQKVVNVIGVRGCPYKCTFCAAAEINGRRVRAMAPGRFVDMLEYYISIEINSFIFYVDTFTLIKRRAQEICEEIIRRRLNIEWKCFTRVDTITAELLTIMRQSGCYCVMFGCETLNDKTLLAMKKGFSSQQCIDGIGMARRAGLVTLASIMVGLPEETESDIRNTVRLALASETSLAFFPVFEPYEGTPIYDLCRRTGKWVVDPRYSNALLKDQESVWVPDTMTRPRVEDMAKEAFRSFYFRPKTLFALGEVFARLPAARKARFIKAGLSYFLPHPRLRTRVGSRFH
jgi:radical SAM superfamily enzyme YgiQ (UPF0313 family)